MDVIVVRILRCEPVVVILSRNFALLHLCKKDMQYNKEECGGL